MKKAPSKQIYLVTGADGFIGSHVVEELTRRGHRVRAMVFYNSRGSAGWLDQSPSDIKKSVDLLAGDMRDPRFASDAVAGADVVIHLAALIAIPYSYRSPDSYIDTNVKGTLNLLTAAREQRLKRFVHVSTSEVYGTAQRVPMTEEHRLNAQSPYAASKIAADQLALSCHRSFGIPVTVMRPFNTYGPRQSARAVIPTIITQILTGKKVVKLGALHPTRDFSYVEDTVNGLIAGAESPRAVGEIINLGTRFEISIGDAAHLIADLMGSKIKILQEDSRRRPEASEVERLVADNSKARRLLGWQPRFGKEEGLRRGLRETINWFLKPENQVWYRPEIYQL